MVILTEFIQIVSSNRMLGKDLLVMARAGDGAVRGCLLRVLHATLKLLETVRQKISSTSNDLSVSVETIALAVEGVHVSD